MASFAEEGSSFNKVVGLGFGGVPSPAALDEIERASPPAAPPVQIEFTHLGYPAIGDLLTGRGCRLASFESVLGLPSRASPGGSRYRGSSPAER